MNEESISKISVGVCEKCGRALRTKPNGLKKQMRITCKCGHNNALSVEDYILIKHGKYKTEREYNLYEEKDVPLHKLLDGPRLKDLWIREEEKHAKHNEGFPREFWPPLQDIINVSINPYISEEVVRFALTTLVERLRSEANARPWSIELIQNRECAIDGLLEAPYFIFIGMAGGNPEDTLRILRNATQGLPSDHPRIGGGAEWEIWSQRQGNHWRSNKWSVLLERWVFLDTDVVHKFQR
jgi:hypothetical protein